MIRVQLPGRFRMYDETRCLNEEAIHSPMITKLLVYMICNKNRNPVPPQSPDQGKTQTCEQVLIEENNVYLTTTTI